MASIVLSGTARLRELAQELRRSPKELNRAQKLAASAAARKGRVWMRRAVKQRADLPQRDVINKLIHLRFKPGEWVLGTKIYAGMSIVYYAHQRIKGGTRGMGIKVRFQPGGAWTRYPHAFEVPSRPTKWGPMIYERTTDRRFPIRVTTGPSVSDKFAEVMGVVAGGMEAFYLKEAERLIRNAFLI